MFNVKPPHKGAWFSTELLLIKKLTAGMNLTYFL